MRVLLPVLAVCALSFCGAVQAQEMEGRFAVRGGFYLGSDFANGTSKTHLEGFEIGADVPIIKNLKGIGGVLFSPTIVFGGSNRKGPDTDGNIYRLMATVKRGFGERGFYAGVGVGDSFTGAHQGQFKDVNGLTAELLAGYLLNSKSDAKTKPFFEVAYFAAGDRKLTGFSFNFGARF